MLIVVAVAKCEAALSGYEPKVRNGDEQKQLNEENANVENWAQEKVAISKRIFALINKNRHWMH